ncbi:MAG: alr [Nitrospirae bacterium]|nr:alr [Nitrospirota bacterium]
MIRGPIAEINLSAIAHNLLTVQKIVKNRPVVAVVKADAYGHGAADVSKKLIQQGVSCLAVAFASEAQELRVSGIHSSIIVLFDHGEIRDFFDHDLLPVISSLDTARRVSEEARKRAVGMKIHVKIDTGMGRLGLQGDDIVKNILTISEMPGLEITGLMSHFSEADLADRSYAMVQLERFNSIRRVITQERGKPLFCHIANSAAVLSFEDAHLDGVRPGLMLYGYSPFTWDPHADLIPAMTLKAKIIDIRKIAAGTPISYGRTFVTKRPSTIGVLALGYADGYNRLFSNNAHVLVRGRKVPVVGRVCMDLTMIDLTDVTGVEKDDEAVIIGKQGDHTITADELAGRANTISYEVLTSLGRRSRRVYVENN